MGVGAQRMVDVQRAIVANPKPVVARVAGPVRAGGIGIVAAADISIAGESATFALTKVRLGLAAATISLTVLPRLTDRAASYTFLTGNGFDGTEAARLGLVTRACPTRSWTSRSARSCSRSSKGAPQGLRESKKLLNRSSSPTSMPAARTSPGSPPTVRLPRGPGSDARLPEPQARLAATSAPCRRRPAGSPGSASGRAHRALHIGVPVLVQVLRAGPINCSECSARRSRSLVCCRRDLVARATGRSTPSSSATPAPVLLAGVQLGRLQEPALVACLAGGIDYTQWTRIGWAA